MMKEVAEATTKIEQMMLILNAQVAATNAPSAPTLPASQEAAAQSSLVGDGAKAKAGKKVGKGVDPPDPDGGDGGDDKDDKSKKDKKDKKKMLNQTTNRELMIPVRKPKPDPWHLTNGQPT